MKKKGQVMILGIMFFVFVVILAIVLASPLKQFIEINRDSAHLDCENSTISDGIKLTCVTADLILPIFFVTLIAAGTTFLVITKK